MIVAIRHPILGRHVGSFMAILPDEQEVVLVDSLYHQLLFAPLISEVLEQLVQLICLLETPTVATSFLAYSSILAVSKCIVL